MGSSSPPDDPIPPIANSCHAVPIPISAPPLPSNLPRLSISAPTTTTTTTTTTASPHYNVQTLQIQAPSHPHPPPHPLSHISKTAQEHPSVSFPVAASGRGFTTKAYRSSSPPIDQMVTVSRPMGYPVTSGRGQPVAGFPIQGRGFGLQSDQGMRPPPPGQSPCFASRQIGSVNFAAPRGVTSALPHNKAANLPTMPSAPDSNNFKDLRDKSKDDAVITVYDRSVRLSDSSSGSLYALCRSWVHNGLPQENLPQVGEGLRLLPRPLPETAMHTSMSQKEESDSEEKDEYSCKEENAGSAEILSGRKLLEGHIKRAKKVRCRSREERLRRIDRYRQRLSLLLPSPSLAEHCRNDVNDSR